MMTAQTLGSTLRQTREEKHLTLDQVFEATKIRVSYLEAIENDRLELLPSKAQARGFIRLYANYLGLDYFALIESLQPPIETPHPSPEKVAHAVEVEPRNREVIDRLVQQSKDALSEKVKEGSEKLQNSVQRISDKIPYRIVKKGEEAATGSKEGELQEPSAAQKAYQAMCLSIGDDLRKKRESLGLSLSDVERQTRIREIYIYALEEGNLDDLPSTVQGRGMLGNYAAFMGLDSEAFLSRFAEALQLKRRGTLPEEKAGVPLPAQPPKQPLTGWKRLLSPDLIFTGGLFLVFFVFIIWGAVQLINVNSASPAATVVPISEILLSSGTPTNSSLVTVEGGTVQATSMATSGFISTDALQATLAATNTDAIQLVILAHRRTFMKITVDGKDAFVGLVVPGNIYSYSGNKEIDLLSGDGSALEAYYNQTNLGILGGSSQVVNLSFTPNGETDLTAKYTPTITPTIIPSLTPQPTGTPTPTNIVPFTTFTPTQTAGY